LTVYDTQYAIFMLVTLKNFVNIVFFSCTCKFCLLLLMCSCVLFHVCFLLWIFHIKLLVT